MNNFRSILRLTIVSALVVAAFVVDLRRDATQGASQVAGGGRYHTRQRAPSMYYRSSSAYQRSGELKPEMQRALR